MKQGRQGGCQASGSEDPDIGVGKEFLIRMLRKMKNDAEQNADKSRCRAKKQNPKQRQWVWSRDAGYWKGICTAVEETGNKVGCIRRNYTGNQGRIVHNSNADDFHGKDGGCKRGAEKC